jgi:aspartyl/asparaginyl beta-hydroxylase (cupin superfamily)/Flp pilus assembly protein TadD
LTAPDDTLIRGLIQQADKAAAAGQRDEVQRLLAQAEAAAPDHPMVLNARAIQLLQSGGLARARELLDRALRQEPRNPSLWMNLATALRALGLRDEEEQALQSVLKFEPRHLLALLQKAELHEFRGKPRAAASVYHNALQTLAPGTRLPPAFREKIARAFEAVRQNDAALAAHVDSATTDVRAAHSLESRDRAEHGLAALLGTRRIYPPQPSFLHVPKLPSWEFYPRSEFPWLAELEAATGEIREECERVLREDSGLEPYITRPEGAPLDQWAELNHSRKWSVFYLWRDGSCVDAHAGRCPRTSALLARLPMSTVAGYSPTAFFSILEPGAHIPAHCGATNSRLIVHLPLVVPPKCRFRVGSETREWREGEAWVFDDTIEHEAWNESAAPRAILIFDIWHPSLNAAERELIHAAVPAVKDYYRGEITISGSE